MQTLETKNRDRPGWLLGLGRFALAFLLSDARLPGDMRPFGLCYALALPGSQQLWATLGACTGSLMIYGRAGLVYAGIGALTLACLRFAVRTEETRELLTPAVLAGVLLVLRLPLAARNGPEGLLSLLLEALLAAAASACLRRGGDLRATALTAMLLCAFAPLKLFGLLTPAAAAAGVTAMLAVRRSPAGAAEGTLLGAAVDLAGGGAAVCAPSFAMAAALQAALPGLDRVSFALCWLAICAVTSVAMGSWGGALDALAAVTVWLLLPDREEPEDPGPLPQQKTPGGLTRLSRALAVFSRASAEGPAEEDVSAVFDGAVNDVCRDCPRWNKCWIEDYSDAVAWLESLRPTLRSRGAVSASDLPAPLAERCIRRERLCGAVNREYAAWLRRRARMRRETERDALLLRQYEGLSAAARGMAEAEERERRPRPTLEKQLNEALRAYGRGLRAEVWSGGGGLTVRVGPFDGLEPWVDESAFLRTAERVTGTRFHPAEAVPFDDCEVLVYRERETLRAAVSAAVRKKPGEELCGDAYQTFRTGDGRQLALLSDGMGSGRQAARLARSALELTAAFLRGGCTAAESAGAVIPFLQARYGAEGFATLDLLELDLFTGACTMIKCGAADSYVVRNGRAERLSRPSLPPGPGGQPETIRFFLREGDAVIMASDGADLSPLTEETCRSLTASELLARFGRGSRDDLTVLVLTTDKGEPGGED